MNNISSTLISKILDKKKLSIIFFLFTFLSAFSQFTIDGGPAICIGETESYVLTNADPSINYIWAITPATPSQIVNVQSFDQAVIQWNIPGTYTITVTGGGFTDTKSVTVYETFIPLITYDNEVGCQKIIKEHTSQAHVIEENECITVCKNSEVEYTVHGTLIGTPPSLNFSNFDWVVTGGEIISADGVSIGPGVTSVTGGGIFSGTISTIIVKWSSSNTGTISVTETTLYANNYSNPSQNYSNPTHCIPKTKTLCFDIIDSPFANFIFDDLTVMPDDCYNICKNATVNFKDLSTANFNSPILFWEWDFGDNSPISHLQNPAHKYINPGTFTVELKVTNKCGCFSIFTHDVCVSDFEAPQIECPSVVCEDDKTKYTVHANCSQYSWSVTGGTILQQHDPNVTIQWNNVNADGFGYIGIDGTYCEDACPNITKIKVPVILQNGTISGNEYACTEESNYYELPAWPATNFKWTITNSNGCNAYFGSFDENSHIVEIISGSSEGSFQLDCYYHNTITAPTCGGSASLVVDVKIKPTIVAPEESCVLLPVTAMLSNYTNLIGQTGWKVVSPSGTVLYTIHIPAPTNNATFPASVFSSAGNYYIYASNPTSFCSPEFSIVKVLERPPTPTAIYGEDYVCPSYPYNYSVDVVDNTISSWSVSGGSISGNSYGNTITSIWTNSTSQTITVNRTIEDIPNCTSGDYTKNINPIVISGSISGLTNVPEDATNQYSLNLNNGLIGESFSWEITNNSGTNVGSVSSGQGTDIIDVTWLHLGVASTSATLTCNVTKCGVTQAISLPITILGNTIITSITGPSSFCSNHVTIPSWIVITSGITPTSVLWDFGDGTTLTQSGSSQPITASHNYINTTSSNQVFTISVQTISGINNTVSPAYTYTVTVFPSPNAGLNPANVENYCPNFLTYPLTISNNAGTYTYQWWFDEYGPMLPFIISGATTSTYTATSTPPTPASTSDGEYWCVVTSANTCITTTNKKIIKKKCVTTTTCTPMAPAGISNYSITNSCGAIQASCNTSGSSANINGFSWLVTGPGTYTSTGTETKDLSKTYTVNKAGIYNIKLTVDYKDAVDNTLSCIMVENAYITVPLVADMKTGIVCGTNGSSYDLLLYDYSTVYPANASIVYQWKINGVIQQCTTANCTIPACSSGSTQIVELTVISGGSTCTTSTTIVMPTIPNADYSTLTTYNGNPSSPYKTCEGREVEFTNLSTPTANITSNIWTFGDGTESHMENPSKTYVYITGGTSLSPLLKVTDRYGCFSTKSYSINIYINDFAKSNPTYNPSTNDVCYLHSLSPGITPQHSGGATPYTYQWYKETNILNGLTSSPLSIIPPGSGAYWVRVNDAHNCYLDINPNPALISIKYPPTANISGKTYFCTDENVKLTAKTGMPASAGLTYQWTYSSNGNSNSTQTAKVFNYLLPAGTYIFTLDVYNPNGCDAVSSPFTVTVHPTPSNPSITLSVVDCDEYKLELSGTSSINPTPSYNWSNGANGQNTYISHGGAYRLWTRDQHGCTSYADIDVPLSPDYYFWRFPIGCYSFCPNELPKHIDGPKYVSFTSWEWYHNGNLITQNGGYAGAGYNTVSDPLIIDQPNNGEGDGDYNWTLNTGLCKQSSDYMNISILECCEVDLEIRELECIQPNGSGSTFSYILSVDNVPCANAYYNIYIIDNNGIPMSSITYSPSTLNAGQTNISGTFIALPNSTDVTFYIEVICDEKCISNTNIDLPECRSSSRIANLKQQSDSLKALNTLLEIIPNPATSNTSISYNFAIDNEILNHKYVLKISDVMGRPIEEIKLDNSFGIYKLNISKYAQGMYFVEIIDNNIRIKIQRMIISH